MDFRFSLNFLSLARVHTTVGAFGDVTYALVGDHSKHFSIDSISGTITVQNGTFLDRERQSEATFSVVAADKAPISSRRSAIVPVRVARIDDIRMTIFTILSVSPPPLLLHTLSGARDHRRCER